MTTMVRTNTSPPQTPGKGGGKAVPERRCLVTRETASKAGLVRFVAGPDGAVVPDVAERLPGRGLWTTARRDIVNTAVAKKLFSRAAKRPLSAADDLADQVALLLARRCCDLLALANRAGIVRAGYEKARAALNGGRAAMALTAADGTVESGGADRPIGQDALALRRMASAAGIAVAPRVLGPADMGRALGRDVCVSLVLEHGADKLVAQLARDMARLAGFVDGSTGEENSGTAPGDTETADGRSA